MNKAAIKTYAVWARRELLARLCRCACEQGFDDDRVIDEAAYTQFTRLITRRYRRVNDYPHDRALAQKDDILSIPQGLLDDIEERLISDIPEEDWQENVEIIGWLYQFYIADKHAAVIDPLHGKVIDKEDIPAATQLFTTDWVVRYILDNSLGRYWLERHPDSNLASKLAYLVTPQSGIKTVTETIKPEDVTVFDPCVGTGHFLSYAFDVLIHIYRECGWADDDAAASIVKHNLYGIDIDDRAVELARFAILMKARQYNSRITEQELSPHIVAMQDSSALTDECIAQIAHGDNAVQEVLYELKTLFANAKEFGSLIDVPPRDYTALCDVPLLRPLVKQAELLSRTYAVVATNPPYMNKYSAVLRAFLHEHFADYKGDLFSVFMFRNFGFCKEDGYTGFMTPNVWMFIKSYEPLRRYILQNKAITTLVQMAKGAFFKEATVDVCAFVLANKPQRTSGVYISLDSFKGDMDVQNKYVLAALEESNCRYMYEANTESFTAVPGSPIAYRMSRALTDAFANGSTLGDCALARNGMKTGDNSAFLRLWWEIDRNTFATDVRDYEQAKACGATWFPYNKGGDYRKWYGNNDYVVNWQNGGERIFGDAKKDGRHVQDYPDELKFSPSLSWSLITSGKPAFRYKEGNLSDIAGMSLFADRQSVLRYLGLLNSSVALEVLSLIAPTINFQAGDIARMPIVDGVLHTDRPLAVVEDNIALSRKDWDAYEVSWDFRTHPLIPHERRSWPMARRIADKFKDWDAQCNARFDRLKANEEELNRLFIDIYGLQNELTPDVEDKAVTVRKAHLERDIKSLLSYAVGCIFGRYSLDIDGLAFAGGVWDASKYQTVIPTADNVLPIYDDGYGDNDLTDKIIDFVKVVYGEETLDDNLTFIADALGGKGTPKEVIRRYLLNGFYADHVKTYQKRPIYWLFDAGKKNSFKALIYSHRYTPELLSLIHTDYVPKRQAHYQEQLAAVTDELEHATPSQRAILTKQQAKLQEHLTELQSFDDKLCYLAAQRIDIDLNDGIKHNYALFGDVLATIK